MIGEHAHPYSTRKKVSVVYSTVFNVYQRKELQINSSRAINTKKLSTCNKLVSSLQVPTASVCYKAFTSSIETYKANDNDKTVEENVGAVC